MNTEYFFTSDTHFGHRLLACDIRGFTDTKSHDEALIEAWNERVKPGDVVYHLGDFMLPQDEAYATKLLRRLHGTKHLLRGNHERKQTERAKGWAWVGDYQHKRFRSGFHVVMFHYAMRTWQGSHHGYFHLYGHSHGNLAPGYGRSMDVGVDTRVDFSPYHFEEIYTLLSDVPILSVDHHK